MADTHFTTQIIELSNRAGVECKRLHTLIGKLSSLNTSDKTSIVAAINECRTAANSLSAALNEQSTKLATVEGTAATNKADLTTAKSNIQALQGATQLLQTNLDTLTGVVNTKTQVADTATNAKDTWSSTKISDAILSASQALETKLLGGAGSAIDTLKELGDLIAANKDLIDSLSTIAAGHVAFDKAQSLTDAQALQARSNIKAVSQADHNTLAGRVTAVETKATNTANDLNTLKTNLGDITSANFVQDFENALAGN